MKKSAFLAFFVCGVLIFLPKAHASVEISDGSIQALWPAVSVVPGVDDDLHDVANGNTLANASTSGQAITYTPLINNAAGSVSSTNSTWFGTVTSDVAGASSTFGGFFQLANAQVGNWGTGQAQVLFSRAGPGKDKGVFLNYESIGGVNYLRLWASTCGISSNNNIYPVNLGNTTHFVAVRYKAEANAWWVYFDGSQVMTLTYAFADGGCPNFIAGTEIGGAERTGFSPSVETPLNGAINYWFYDTKFLPISNLTNHTAQLFVAKIQDNVVGSDEVALSTGNADTGNYFRVSGNQYIYNLDTGTLTPGTWQLKALLDDGTSHTVIISIKS